MAFHLLVFGVAGKSLPVYMNQQVTDGILYFAPPPVAQGKPTVERLTFLEMPSGGLGALAVGTTQLASDGPAIVHGDEGISADKGNGATDFAALGDMPRVNVDSVYFPDEVDNPAAYDPRSAAPAYPDSLQGAGIEGSVTVQFVVDTTGRAAPASLLVVGATHPRFAQSVTEALPRMLFTPAQLMGVKIRQLVQQTFTFRLPGRSGASGSSALPSTAPPPGYT